MLYTPPPAARAVELTAKQMFMLFPTPMFTGKLPDIGLCNRIEKKLRELQQSGKGTSSREGQILAYMTPDEELAMIRRCVAILEKTIGRKPLGWLSPVIASTDTTAELLSGEGFLWHGDYNDEDLPRLIKDAEQEVAALTGEQGTEHHP